MKYSYLRDIIFLYMISTMHEGVIMAVSYKRLFHLLIERTCPRLQQQAGFSANIITRMERNGYLIESICRMMNCGVDDILEFLPEDMEKV